MLFNFRCSEECRWCPDFGSLCFYQPRACCGCLESGCFSCPSSSSCALWSPFSPLQCPPPSTYNNNTRWGSCKWELQAAIEQGGRSVLRCNTVNPRATVDIVWNVVSSTGSESFDVLILDQENFNQYLKGGSFTCRNINCSSGGPPGSARGDIRVSGSKGYYVVTADRSERGTWNYSIFASIQ